MKAPKRVTIEVQCLLPRPRKDDPSKMTKTRCRQWLPIGKWPVVYQDKRHIVVKQFGAISIYGPEGWPRSVSWSYNHPKSNLLPIRIFDWRIQPASLKK